MNPVRDKNLESSGSPSASVSNGMKRVGVVLILVFAFLGLANAIYIAGSESAGTPLICNLQSFSGCNTVAESEYSRILGIRLSHYGVLFFGLIFVLSAIELVLVNRQLRRILQAGSIIGATFSVYFLIIQAFYIGAFCIYCLASSVAAFLIFASAFLIEPIRQSPMNGRTPTLPFMSNQLSRYKKTIQMPPAS